MKEWKYLNHSELRELLVQEKSAYEVLKSIGLKLDLSRGKPGPDVLDLSNGLLGSIEDYRAEDGTDCRNYGVVSGLPELRRMFSELLGIDDESIVVGGNSSLFHMYNVMSQLYLFGSPGTGKPWSRSEGVKILCPVPGYDRHFTLTEDFGATLIPIRNTENGPDMDEVESIATQDPAVKGIWVVPLYSNPTGSVCSTETAERLAGMKTAAEDFHIFWDNAYGVHHLWEEHSAPDILKLCENAGNPGRAYYFFSTSKVTYPGAGVGLVASDRRNMDEFTKHLKKQTIGFDKLNQLRQFRFFDGDTARVREHMRKIAHLLRPKFELVMNRLDKDFKGTGLLSYTRPKGGYFISVELESGCAKRTVELASESGAVLTPAGATWPYGKDPHDSNIRIAPTYPNIVELDATMDLFERSVKIAALEKYIAAKEVDGGREK